MADNRIQVIIDGTAHGLQRAAESAHGAISDMGGKMGGIAKGIGLAFGTAAVAGVAALGKAMMDSVQAATAYSESIDKMAKTTGAGYDELQKLKYAADMEYVSTESLEKGLNKLAKGMESAKGGTGATADAFKEMGISVTNADGSLRNSTDVLMDVADYMKTGTDDAQKQALAMALLGRSGAEMIPFLEQGSGAIRALGDEAESTGMVMSEEAIKGFEAYGDMTDKLKKTFQGLQFQVAQAVLPAFSSVTDSLTTMMQQLQDSGVLERLFSGLAPIIQGVMPALGSIVGLFGELAAKLGPVIGEVFGKVGEIFGRLVDSLVASGVIDALAEVGEALGEVLVQALEALAPLAEDFFGILVNALEVATPLLEIAAGLIEGLAPAFEMLGDVVSGIVNPVLDFLEGIIDGLKEILGLSDEASGTDFKPPTVEEQQIIATNELNEAWNQLYGSLKDVSTTDPKVLAQYTEEADKLARKAADAGVAMTDMLSEMLRGTPQMREVAASYVNEYVGGIADTLSIKGADVKAASDAMMQYMTIPPRERSIEDTNKYLEGMVNAFAAGGGDRATIRQQLIDTFNIDVPTVQLTTNMSTIAAKVSEVSGLTQEKGSALAVALTNMVDSAGGQMNTISAEQYRVLGQQFGLTEEQTRQAMSAITGYMTVNGASLAEQSFGSFKNTAYSQLDAAAWKAEVTMAKIKGLLGQGITSSIKLLIYTIGQAAGQVPHGGGAILHGGGEAMRPDERMIKALAGEYMFNRNAAAFWGRDVMDAMNAMRMPPGMGAQDNSVRTITVYADIANGIDLDEAWRDLARRCFK